jgi:ubiquinone/menaquinone biosynthesis C-methylase UbiE
MALKDRLKSSEIFYNNISGFYDGMINFSSALLKRKDLLNRFSSGKIRTAADIGCGTGLDSISLAMNGISVTGFDLSSEMINQAKVNAKNAGVENINFHKSSIEKIPASYHNKFDLAVSLGNTLANINEKKLHDAVAKINKLLNKNGVIVIQVLNYAKLIKENDRIVNINSADNELFIRFYDFLPGYINFNILKINNRDYLKRDLYTTTVYPHGTAIFSALLKKNNFRNIKFYGSLDFSPYKRYHSKDLIITAEK